MSEPWFDPQLATWLPGTVLGVAAGMVGMLAGMLAGKAWAKPWLYAVTIVLLVISLGLAALGGVAYSVGQPRAIGSSFVFTGLICAVIAGTLLFVIPAIFRSGTPPGHR